ncbi:Metallo-dependent hydrolase [Coprinopsis marcescibilis]|uniref:Metallo-dependent hydrolase n=1 Tax=Coprinopsis marcescibilis TaxID=230819 RepID=A0A5C3KRP8_COPMA|nr:Metallo-dependent hydrolase [Coprinopsis marcescibilis]
MSSPNGLVCFTNCLLPQEDGSLIAKDLWIDERTGLILDPNETFFGKKLRPGRTVDLSGDVLSPGFLDIQINGAYGFDFSVYENNDDDYREGMQMMAEKIIETGVTSLLPTIITQEKSFYPKLLQLLRPFSTPKSATLLGWHAEGPFLEYTKRGAHAPPYLVEAPKGFNSFEEVYGKENLIGHKEWYQSQDIAIRMITAAPELPGVLDALQTLTDRGIVVSIGHSNAQTDIAMAAVKRGAKLITHLFNAMPQFHHRDPSIVGLLGASPFFNAPIPFPLAYVHCDPKHTIELQGGTSPTSPSSKNATYFVPGSGNVTPGSPIQTGTQSGLDPVGRVVFERPFYGIIVDGIHCHPNSVRLAYSAHPNGCILITDAMKILDPNLKDGIHEWRDGKRFVKEGERLYLEGTNTLAGSVVTLDKCVRNFATFTGCSLGEAIKCVTYNPARCLGIEHIKGTLRPGAHADLVVLDRYGCVKSTWIRGNHVWSSNSIVHG